MKRPFPLRPKVSALALLLTAPALILVGSCSTTERLGGGLGRDLDAMTEPLSGKRARQARARGMAIIDDVATAREDFTPEQEYYIGRAVGAEILSQYTPYDDEAANEYLNLIGQSLSLASRRPELFAGYRFLILDSDEVNAFATPSGLVMVTRGALRLADSEDAVASILAHEIGHIESRHGISAIKASRVQAAVTSNVLSGVGSFDQEGLQELTETFKGSIGDITSTLVNTGYSRSAEVEADRAAVRIMTTMGYDPGALVKLLRSMSELEGSSRGLLSTHPAPSRRIQTVSESTTTTEGNVRPPTEVRKDRFRKALGSI